MLVSAPPTPGRDRTAIAISIAVHCCVLAVLALLPGATFPATDPDERTLIVGKILIEHRPPAPTVRVRRVVAAPVAQQQQQAVRPVIHTLVATGHATRDMVVAREVRAAAVPARTKLSTPPPPPARSDAVQHTAVAQQQPVQTASQPAPTSAPATPAPSPVAAQRDDGIGNFGETYPAAVDPSLRATLFAGISGIVVRVTVDESGHATSIEFVRAPADSAQREELRSRLLAAHFIPANCNGLRCTGTVELKN
jgi:hypothetical protein